MRVLVTGGLGFTGSALVLRLLRDGHQVVVLDRNPGLCLEEIRERGAETHLGSVADKELVDSCSRDVEVVLHLAAAFREIGAPDSLYDEVNVVGTRHVVESAIRAGARKLVYCSTQGVHGHVESPPGDESTPIAPADYYQKTKYLGEEEVRRRAGDIESVIIRPTAIYGPGDPGRFVMIYRLVSRGWFPMFGPGETYYHPVYVENLVDAFLLAMAPGVGAGEAYIVADEEYLPIRSLVRKVGEAIGVDVRLIRLPLAPLVAAGHVCQVLCKPFGLNPPIFPRRVDWYRQVRAFRIDKAKRELGYRPEVDLDTGLRLTGRWYRDHHYIR